MGHKTIYLIRHGQTDYNLKKVVQGSGIDASLNKTGREQAERFFQEYGDLPFEKVYTSTLQRSIESVQRFIDLGIAHEMLSGLDEINWGTREGMQMTEEENEYYLNLISAWQGGKTNVPVEGGESPDDVQKRMKPAIDHILSGKEELILICMHGRAMRIFLATLLNYPLHAMDIFEHRNLGLYLLRNTGNQNQILKYNDGSHLEIETTV